MPVDAPRDRPVCLTASNISFWYGAEPVLEDVTLAVRQEEFVGIAGPNGSGKTTLLKILVGLLMPETGTVEFTCHMDDCEGMSPCRPCIGYVPQQPVLRQQQFPVTVREVIEMGTYGQSGIFTPAEHRRTGRQWTKQSPRPGLAGSPGNSSPTCREASSSGC